MHCCTRSTNPCAVSRTGDGSIAINALLNNITSIANTKNTTSVLETLIFDPRNGKKYSNKVGNIHLFNANVIKYSAIPTQSRISMNFLSRNHSRLSCLFIYFSKRYPRPRIVRIYADGSSSSFARSLLMQTIILLSATI